MTQRNRRQAYWRENTKLIAILLSVWALFGLVFSILLVEPLNHLATLGKLPLGFWIAQQGSIYVFVVLIFIYAMQMDKLDQRYSRQEQDEQGSADS